MKFLTAILALFIGSKAVAMDFTNGFVLETQDGAHVGFVLGSPSFKVNAGECVFMLAPGTVDVIETPLGIAISELKVTGEHPWKKKSGDILVLEGERVLLKISHNGLVLDMNGNQIGKAKPLPAKG